MKHSYQNHDPGNRDLDKEARHFLARAYSEYGDEDSASKILFGGFDRQTYFALEAIKSAIKCEISTNSQTPQINPVLSGIECQVSHRRLDANGREDE